MRYNYKKFLPYNKHRAVTETHQLINKIGTANYLLGLFYEDLPSVKQKFTIPDQILAEVHPNKDSAQYILDQYMQLLAQFYRDTHFDQFLAAHKNVYDLAIRETMKNLPGKELIPVMEAYYGQKKNGYYIIVMPFFKSQFGMGWEIEDKGKKNVYQIVSPFQEAVLANNFSVIKTGYDNKDEVRNWSVHEFGHSFANMTTMNEQFAQEINKYKHLFKPIKDNPQYADWGTVFNEHLVRAGEIRIALKMNQKEISQKLYKDYQNYMYLDHFIAQLKVYEANRHKYPDIDSFIPVLIQSLSKLR